jgi:hypothetical protein
MNPNTPDLIKEKVRVIEGFSRQLESWEQDLRANFNVDTIETKFLPDSILEYEDKTIQKLEDVDEIEFDEACTRNMLAHEQISKLRNLQRTFRSELLGLVSKIVNAPKRILQKTKSLVELGDKEKFVAQWIDETCPITQAPIIDPLKSICCGKIFNRLAFDKWIEKEFSCPTCRRPIKKEKTQYVILPEPVPKKVEEVMFTTPCCRRTVPVSVYNLALETSNGFCPICRHDIYQDLLYSSLMQALQPQQTGTRATSGH